MIRISAVPGALDLKASTSFDALMKQIGAGFLERKYADSVKLKATLQQNEHVLTIAARGPGFAFDEILYLDGRTAPGKLDLLERLPSRPEPPGPMTASSLSKLIRSIPNREKWAN